MGDEATAVPVSILTEGPGRFDPDLLRALFFEYYLSPLRYQFLLSKLACDVAQGFCFRDGAELP